MKNIKYRINSEIPNYPQIRLVGDESDGGIMPISRAREIAQAKSLDLVELNSHTEVPIIKICNYEKMAYEAKKAAKKQTRPKPLKEIQLSANIAEHDLDTKVNHAKKFITDGNKVKVTLALRGRELAHKEQNQKSLLEFLVKMEDVAIIEGALRNEGNRIIAYLKKK